MDNMKVKVVYRDKYLNPTYEKTYLLQDYTDMIRQNLLRVIADVEDMVYISSGNKPKDEWSDDTWVAFQKVKHKILDNAGSIGRLPVDLIKDDGENAEA